MFGNTIVASLGTATICFQTTSGEFLAYDTDVIQLNAPALFGLLLMRVANADVLVSSMQLRSPTWSADLREHGGRLYVKEKRNIVPSNYLKAGVPDAVNFADKSVVNMMMTRLNQRRTGRRRSPMRFYFSALSNMHTQLGHARAEAMLRFLEVDILPVGVDSITRADIKRVIRNCTIYKRFDPNLYAPEQLSDQTSSLTNQSILMFSTLMDILCCQLCALVSGTQRLVLCLA
jgi:hypothetical protein